MRLARLCSFFIALTLSTPALADSYNDLSDNIRAYRNLTNTPTAPDVEFTTQDGQTVSLADFKGKTILLNLWATWCPPCIREMPALNALAKEFKDHDFVVLAVATGRQGREKPDAFLEKRNLTDMISLHDPKQNFLRMMEINSLPVTFIIDKEGRMRGGVIGMTKWDTDKAKIALKKAITQ
ncbi:TlpA family protein disulfide reductase [Terasakiella sp. SH-1]|uniref:TlpA disulfide reductase family protein n=1 Tax=Terasakiella sp. SH-1 TaxID=2560057 RepID=UPI0010744A64|nr:TlpA family protein disulfide reductase [Terasakiella sp. SH-1]